MELRPSEFLTFFSEVNGLQYRQLDRWILYPGMLFGSRKRWWGAPGERPRPHEGIDICFYRDSSGDLQQISPLARVPAMYPGEVVQIVDDYLGRSIVMAHDAEDERGNRLHSIYGHTDDHALVRIGSICAVNDIIARVTDAGKKNPSMASHLHLTVAWIPPTCHPAQLSWHSLQTGDILLINPLTLLSGGYELLEEG